MKEVATLLFTKYQDLRGAALKWLIMRFSLNDHEQFFRNRVPIALRHVRGRSRGKEKPIANRMSRDEVIAHIVVIGPVRMKVRGRMVVILVEEERGRGKKRNCIMLRKRRRGRVVIRARGVTIQSGGARRVRSDRSLHRHRLCLSHHPRRVWFPPARFEKCDESMVMNGAMDTGKIGRKMAARALDGKKNIPDDVEDERVILILILSPITNHLLNQ